jgi:hypothetical protein
MINLTANGNSTVSVAQEGGGQYYLDVHGTFGSGKVTVEISHDGGVNFYPVTTSIGVDLEVTADYNAVLTIPGLSQVKFILQDATSTPNVDIILKEI